VAAIFHPRLSGNYYINKCSITAGHTVIIADKNGSKKYPHLRVYADVREPDTLGKALAGSDAVINLAADPENSLTIIRPTVIFGEQNRGNVYNLLHQIAGGKFPMVGKGTNFKSMAYVENVAAFIEYNLNNAPGEHLFNYIDKPDFDMNTLVAEVNRMLGKLAKLFHWPYWLGYFGGLCFDLLAKILRKQLSISSIRVKKFCANTMFEAANIKKTDFNAPVTLAEGLERTLRYEFIDKIADHVFYTE
jgi:nucleoside-diphosphate-sugar epimerase